MSLSVLVASILMGQSAFSMTLEVRPPDKTDVAYEELQAGKNEEALNKLRTSEATQAGDPAALINMGTAYHRVGMTPQAIASYRAAIKSSQRYELELADGSWMDSRWAARKAMQNLRRTNAQAMR